MRRTNGRGVIFDLDGVVIDSIWSIWRATRDLLDENGVEFFCLPSFDEFLGAFSMPNDEFYQSYGLMIPSAKLDRRFLEIIPNYESLIEPYPGMPEVLTAFRQSGFPLAIASAGNPERVMGKLKRFSLTGLFDAVYAGAPNKTVLLKTVCRDLGLVPARTCFVGDIKSDMRDGYAAGLIPIGFAAGYDFMTPILQAAGARQCVHEPEELLALTRSILV